ncbi:MAG: hydroxymethylglutaryl-CoA synthase, partial [Halobacteriales archaeon]|nr:hydroxymethylglutaryl-CoA synthase [Halobacteriales archaeon]
IRDYMDALAETEMYRTWYDATIEPTLDIARQVGNWYTSSVHVARLSALKHAARVGEDVTGDRLLVASYGSGAQAEIHDETIMDGWREAVEGLTIEGQLEARVDLSFEEYERVHDRHNHEMDVELEDFTSPEDEFIFDGWGRMGERKYTYVD